MSAPTRLIPAHALLATIALTSLPAAAAPVDEAPIGEAVERHLADDAGYTQWVQDPERIATEKGDALEMRETTTDALETVKISGLVAPIQFASGVAQIPDDTVESLAAILERMQDRINVRLHLVGHADDRPLSPRLVAIYGDNAGLSRERAGQVAEHFQVALALPPEAISFAWAGDTQPVASNLTEAGRALNRRVEVEVWYDELSDRIALEEILVPHEIERVKVCRMETVCKLRYVEERARRARVRNLVAPLHYDSESIQVDDAYVERVSQTLRNLASKDNVVVRFVGYTDDTPLGGRTQRIYRDHIGLSRARARRVALSVQDRLGLPTAAIESDGRGASNPLGSNRTDRGRALNRRIEVEFWYDDPLEQLPDEPQLCPESAGAEVVARTYTPPWGAIPHIVFVDGQPVVPPGFAGMLARALADIADETNPRLKFVGFTGNERLTRRTAAVYGDDIGLSASRARRAMEKVGADTQLADAQLDFEGRGFVHSDDVVNVGFTQGDHSFVAVRVMYDELAVLDDYEGVDVMRLTRELEPENPLGLNLMRITVDGVPIDDPERSSSDIQRCTDVALHDAKIRFGYDNLRSAPRLSVAASTDRVALADVLHFAPLVAPVDFWTDTHSSPVHFRMYTNYSHFVDRAEIRIFFKGQSVESDPVAVIPIGIDQVATWEPEADDLSGRNRDLAYVLRAYGQDGNFDETRAQPLWVTRDALEADDDDAPDVDPEADPQLLAAYGENALSTHNIGLSSGTVTVRGSGIAAGNEVWVAGRPVPLNDDGSFVAEEILPEGAHTVEVAVLDEEGRGELYLRDLELKSNDWFYVGMADLTIAGSSSSGPIDLVQGANSDYDYDSSVDGRLAFFVDGKFGDHWKLTASADTREGPLDALFSNFLDKSPESLFRRMDPDYYYPTFGDDGTVEEMAPSMGRFYVRLGRDDDYGQWGNFRVGYMNNELAQVDRGLYGANLHYQSDATTRFGDRRLVVDAFAAEPGTVASREEFRGTGGSLYFLERQDILPGSERVRIETRDKTSGLVTGVVNLQAAMDYDVDYLQGRILLAEPLASSASDGLLVRSDAISGDEAYLVVRYEYTPGFDDIDALATGAQAHYWFGDHVRFGMTMNVNEQDADESNLGAADLTLRLSAGSWLKLQHASTEGLVSATQTSVDGGFGFTGDDPAAFADARADAKRADLSISLDDFSGLEGKLALYVEDVEAGFSAPGLTAPRERKNYGGQFSLPVGERFSLLAKVDNREQDRAIETRASEVNLGYQLTDRWWFKAGYRQDERTDGSIIVPFTQEQGEREEGILQVGYDSGSSWSAYAFTQDTLAVSGDRPENARSGLGGSVLVGEKLRIEGEISDGDLGAGGRLGSNYEISDDTNLYLNYALDDRSADTTLPGERDNGGNLVAGVRSRIADSTSVFLEERYQHGRNRTGLTHATGISFAPTRQWSLGLTTDIGSLRDVQTNAETERRAGGAQIGFASDALQLSSGIEYRNDDSQQLDLATTERTTWLFRNSIKYQISPDSRLLGKFNHSESESSLGTFYDGGYTEAVLGYAVRPVSNDRLNALAKYTYFYNVPTADQIGAQNVAAEFLQKSHIAALDVTYDLTPALSIGGKYAYRLGQVSLDRDSPDYFDNNASLAVLRGDYRFGDDWELLVEGRLLSMPDLDERRSGMLATVSRYLGDHLKLGVGYNFTDFSDDLTDLSFDHHGVFLSITGTL